MSQDSVPLHLKMQNICLQCEIIFQMSNGIGFMKIIHFIKVHQDFQHQFYNSLQQVLKWV